MKKIIHILIIVFFIAAVCVTEQLLVQEYLATLNQKTSNIKNLLATTEDLTLNDLPNYTDELDKYWNEKEKVLCTFINHKDIEEIGKEINIMKTAITNNDKSKYEESLNLVKYYLASYQHILGINLQNIL